MGYVVKKGNLFWPSKEMKKIAWVKNKKIYKEAEKNPKKFWEKAAKEISWFKQWKKVYLEKAPYFKWFVGGKLNISYNCLDRHLKNRKNKVALIWEPEPLEEKPKTFTYFELYQQVNKLANALKKLGVKKGDTVGIYLPMIPETVISMLACTRIGAIHTVVFSAFSPESLRTRLQISDAKILITADGYYRRGKIINLKESADEGIKETKVEKTIVVKRIGNEIPWNREKDFWFEDLIRNESEECKPEEMDSEDLLFILFTSGTTGIPKGIIHSCGGYTVQAYLTGKLIFDFHEKDVLWCTSDFGWITGHTYTCYSPLLNGITTLVFEGAPDYPTNDRWAQIIEKHKVTIFYTAPTAIRMFEKMNGSVAERYNFKTLRLLGSVGEPIDEAAWFWYFKNVGKERCPIVDTWWQTETGGILISSLPGIGPFKPAFVGLPFPGVKAEIFDEKGRPCKKGEQGNLVILPPFPPGLLRGVYKDEKRYLETYWSKYGNKVYFTSDGAFMDENGLIRIVGRVDDVIKVAGHRISTGEIESALNSHLAVVESAVVGMYDEIKGEVPFAFVVIKQGFEISEKLAEELIKQVEKKIGPIARPAKIVFVDDLPKTRSGKIVRRILRNILRNESLGDLSTVANPECIEKIKKKASLFL
ncbi:MAG: acetate--CoA ligase [Candidatus Aenigmarchaeota archaeon]|nr:acetate--CoA ligase [Candidatus Aenigmarchaeota archaeon]